MLGGADFYSHTKAVKGGFTPPFLFCVEEMNQVGYDLVLILGPLINPHMGHSLSWGIGQNGYAF